MANKKYYETEEFRKLQNEWYDKLKEDGFQDIEYTDRKTGEVGNVLLGFSAMDAVRGYTQEKRDFFYRASQYLTNVRRSYGWTSPEARVWKVYSNGGSLKQIRLETGIGSMKAKRIIRELREAMFNSRAMQGLTRDLPDVEEPELIAAIDRGDEDE